MSVDGGEADRREDEKPAAPKGSGPAAPDPKPEGDADAERRERAREKASQDRNEDG